MRLTLHYRGPLRASGGPGHKHDLRRLFHLQLARLWQQRPLAENPDFLKPRKRKGDYSLLRDVPPFKFVPLVTAEMDAIAEVSVLLLRPEPPGGLLTQGGDIDNRLKTLFDALAMPQQTNALPSGAMPSEDESPFFCLLENDSLVTAVSVRTEQLLEPDVDSALVDVVIQVRTRVTRHTMGNDPLS